MAQKISNILSVKMANMSVLAACMVVVLHAGEPESVGTSGWWWAQILGGIAKVAVPYFFLAAGFFLAGHMEEPGWYRREMSKRVLTLLVPYLCWCVIWWLFYLPFGMRADVLHSRPFGYSLFLLDCRFWDILGLNLFHCPTNSPLWFLRALFIVCAASPIIYWGSWKMPRAMFGGLLAGYLVLAPDATNHSPCSWLMRYGISVFGCFWFSVGVVLRLRYLNYITLQCTNKKWALMCLPIGTLMTLVNVLLRSHAISVPVEPFAIAFLMVGFFLIMPSRRWHSILVSNTFELYLLHSIACFVLSLFLVNTDLWWVLTLKVVLAVILGLSMSLALKRLFPKVALVVFGGR